MINLTMLPDQELVSLSVNGNTEAMSTLVYRHKTRIYTSIFLLVKDKHLAEDFFQDTFFKIIDTLKNGSYKEEGKFLPWALRIAHNLCIDHFRKIARKPVIKTSEGQDIFDTLNFSEPGADERITKGETFGKLIKMLDILPQDQREVIIMRHYADMSFKEIAQLTNCSINTALGRMRYGLINLRRMMVEKQIAL